MNGPAGRLVAGVLVCGLTSQLHNKKSDGTVVAGLDYVYDQAKRRTAKVVNLLEADDSRAQHTIYYDYDKAGHSKTGRIPEELSDLETRSDWLIRIQLDQPKTAAPLRMAR